MQQAPMTEQDLDRLETLLAADNFQGEAMSLDVLQGFLCAVVSGPDTVDPDLWVAEVLGGAPRYASPEQEKELRELLLKFYHDIDSALANREEFDLILYGFEDDPEELDFASWCDGYVYGSQMGEENWFEAAGEFAEDLNEKMEVFFLLNGVPKEDALKNKEPWMPAKEEQTALEEAQDELPIVIGDIYRFWQSQRNPVGTLRRESPKVGRNDPCPCGSGKKYKQCCGQGPSTH